MVIRLLFWIGLVRRHHHTRRIVWPLSFAPLWMWKCPIVCARCNGVFYVFRNVRGVIKWEKGRLLPKRWGVGFCGLIEFGDRG